MVALDRKYRKACFFVEHFNQRIKDKQVRYMRACSANQRALRASLRLHLDTMEGLRELYYKYACQKIQELEALQEVLVEEGVLSEEVEVEELHWTDGI